MTEGDVREGLEHRRIHIVQPADGDFLRIRARRSRHELMSDQHAAPLRIERHVFHRDAQRIRIALHLFLGKRRRHVNRLDKRKQINIDGAVLVRQRHRTNLSVVSGRGNMDAAFRHDASAVSHPRRRVMVAADNEHRLPVRRKLRKEVVEQPHRLRRRRALVVDVPGNQHGVRLFLPQRLANLPQNERLVLLQKGTLIEPLPQMQV